MIEVPDWLNSTLASDAGGGAGAITSLVPLRPGQLAVGPATTVRVAPGDNGDLRAVLAADGEAGGILVVAGSGASDRAVIGGLMGSWIENRGYRAVVIEGRVRDSAELRTLKLQVWCTGVTPVAAGKEGGGAAGGTIRCAGVEVSPGDWVIADDDGVVVWPAAEIPALLEKARARLEKDTGRAAILAAGGGLD